MSLGCGASFAKYVLIAVNTIFLLLGLGLGIAGLVFRFGTELLGDNIKDALKELQVDVVGGIDIYKIASSLSLLLIIVGFFIFIVGALGCCGACCSNRVLLMLYVVIVMMLLIIQIAAVALFAAFRSSFDGVLKTSFKQALNTTYNEPNNSTLNFKLKESFNALFSIYKCCGVESSSDVYISPLPDGCCGGNCTISKPYKVGCFTKLEEQIEEYNNVFIGVGISVLVFQLLCIIFSFCLCVAIGRDE